MGYCLFGGPASGKGTQSKILAEKLAAKLSAELGRDVTIPIISTGDLLREAFPEGTKEFTDMKAGKFVSDSVVNGLLRKRFSKGDCNDGFILDGYPRTMQQKTDLDIILKEFNLSLDGIIFLEVPPQELQNRYLNRITEIAESVAAAQSGGSSGQKVQQRNDNDAFAERLDGYTKETLSVLAAYRQEGLVKIHDIDGSASKEQTAKNIEAALGLGAASITWGSRVIKGNPGAQKEFP